MRDGHVTELADGFLLGALEPREDEAVRAHIAECEACAHLLAESRVALDALAASLDPIAPSHRARERLLAAARGEHPAARRGLRARVNVPLWSLGVAAGLALAAVGGLAAVAGVLSTRLDDRDEDLVSARQAVAAFAASARTLHMESEYSGHAIDAAIAVPGEGNAITVVVTGLPQPGDGEGYRLWLLAEGSEPTGLLLSPDGNGNAVATLNIDLAQFDEMELDAQPLEASAPGGELVIGGPLR